jgi:hypothetical protein
MSKIILKEMRWIVEEKRKIAACWRQQHNFPPSKIRLTVEEAVLKYGRGYIGIERPKGFRGQRARGQCFANAADTALRGRGQYVEGYALNRPDHLRMIFHHAWITVDGVHAIDQTLADAPAHDYFGVPFANDVLTKAFAARGYYGVLGLLLEQPEKAPEMLGL